MKIATTRSHSIRSLSNTACYVLYPLFLLLFSLSFLCNTELSFAYSVAYRATHACNTLGGRNKVDCTYDAVIADDQSGVGLATVARLTISAPSDMQTKYTLHWKECKWSGISSLYRDGCGFGWYSPNIYTWNKDDPVLSDDPASLPVTSLGFTSYGRHMRGAIFRINNSNRATVLATSHSYKSNVSFSSDQINLINSSQATVCIYLTTDNSSTPYYLIGCVPDQTTPAPPVLNPVAVYAMEGVVVTPGSGDTRQDWYKSINSTFDSPAVNVLYGGSQPQLTLTVENLLLSGNYGYSGLSSCSSAKTFPPTYDLSQSKYYATVNQDVPDQICVYRDICPSTADEAANALIGCAPRPGILESTSPYIPLVDYTTICDAGSSSPATARFYAFDVTSGACVAQSKSGTTVVTSAKPRRAVSLFFLDRTKINMSAPNIGQDLAGNQIALQGQSNNHYYNVVMNTNPLLTVVGDFFTLYNLTMSGSQNYITIKKMKQSVIPMKFAMISDDTSEGDTSSIVLLDGGQPAYRDVQIAQDEKGVSVTHKQYTQDSFALIPASVNGTCLVSDSSSKNNCLYPSFTANVVIPNLNTDGSPDTLRTDVNTEVQPQPNCTLYLSPLDDPDGTITLYQPARAALRDTSYCFCDTTPCTSGDSTCCNQTDASSNCTCQLCSNDTGTTEVAPAACHGDYLVDEVQPDAQETDVIRDKICFYFVNSWDFITGDHIDSDDFWGNRGVNTTRQLYCATLPAKCYRLNMPADWNGYGVWNSSIMPALSGQKNVTGECAQGYEPAGRDFSLKNPSTCDPISTSVDTSLLKTDYSAAATAFQRIKSAAAAKQQQLYLTDFENDPDVQPYLQEYTKDCNNQPGYTETPPPDANKPLADCIAGVFENFRNACVPQQPTS